MLVRLLRQYLTPYRREIAIIVALQFVATMAVLYLPSLNADIIDDGVAKGDTGYIIRTGSVMLVVSLVQILCSVGAVYVGARTASLLGRDLRSSLFHHVGSFSGRELAHFGAPSLITRTTNDVQQVQMLVLMTCTMMVAAPIMMVGGVLMAVREDVGLSWLVAVSVPLLFASVGLIASRMVPGFREMQTRIDAVNRVMREQITGIRVVRAFVREPVETERFGRANEDLARVAVRVGRWMATMFPVVMLILNVSSVAVLWFGGHRVDEGAMQVGSLTAFLAYLVQILMAVMMASFMLMMVPRAAVCADRITEVLDTGTSVVPPAEPVTEPTGSGLRMRGVSFTYPGAEAPVLRDVDLDVRPGTTLAVIGSTGAGKTTLVNLVPRLFDVTDGVVEVEGVDVRRLDPDVLWSRIGLVPQKAFLFSGTVASNLRYGKPDATDEEMWQALEIAQARDLPVRRRVLRARPRHRRAAACRARPAHDRRGRARGGAARLHDHRRRRDPRARGRRGGRSRHPRRAAEGQPDLPGDRRVPAHPGGGGMSEQQKGRLKETERVQMGGPGRGGPFGGAMVGQKSMDFGPSAKRLVGRLAPQRLKVAVVLLLAVASVALSVVGPRILGHATDLIFEGLFGRSLPAGTSKADAVAGLRARGEDRLADMLAGMDVVPGRGVDFDAVGRVLLLVLAIYVAASLLMWLQGYILNDVVQSAVRRMRDDVEAKIHRLPLSYFDRQPRGELLSRVTNDIDNISQTLQQTMSQLLVSLLTVIGVLAMMFSISPTLALIALVTVPIGMALSGQIMKRSQGLFIQQWRRTGTLNGHIEEAFTGHGLVKVFGRQREVEQVFEVENDELYKASFGAQFVSGLIMPVMMFLGNLNYVVIAVLGGLRVANGSMSLGEVQAFIQYSRQFTQPLTQVASMVNLLQSGVASAERVFELLDAEEEPVEEHAAPAEGGRGEVRFEHVSFRYDPDRPLIEDLSLVARPGQTVAIVGPTGAGKTTLVNLVMRFYDVDAGRITLDGVDISTMPRAALRGRTGMVLQDTWLFEGTIRDNIAYGRPDATEEEILEAARATFVDRFVHNLPDGYDTVIDEEGGTLSAGERQLVTIARAFLARPALLILDEATSSVDTPTELLVQHAMAALRADRTSFVIAHRLSTIRDADVILVMEDGRIVEQGTHDELLARGGAYNELYQAQFAAPATDAAIPAAELTAPV